MRTLAILWILAACSGSSHAPDNVSNHTPDNRALVRDVTGVWIGLLDPADGTVRPLEIELDIDRQDGNQLEAWMSVSSLGGGVLFSYSRAWGTITDDAISIHDGPRHFALDGVAEDTASGLSISGTFWFAGWPFDSETVGTFELR